MKHKLATTLLLVAALAVATLSAVATTARPAQAANGPGTHWPIVGYGPNEATDNAILRWNERLLESIRVNPRLTGPTVSARSIGVLHTATYDAWAAYDAVAVDTRQRLRADPTLRRPAAERTVENKSKAISYAAYRVLLNLFPTRASIYSTYMSTHDLRPQRRLHRPRDPAGRRQPGRPGGARLPRHRRLQPDAEPGRHGRCYPNNTTYTPTNTWNQVVDPTKWQQLCVLTPPAWPTTCRPSRRAVTCAAPNYTSRPRPPRSGRTSPRSARWTR